MEAGKKYVMQEWKSGAEMHEDAKLWISELEFIASEHHFFEDLLNAYFLQLSTVDHYNEGKKLVDELEGNRTKNDLLLTAISDHNNRLIVLLDGKNEFEREEEVKQEHRDLDSRMLEHEKLFRTLKAHIFRLIGTIIEEIKKDRLLGS